MRGCMPFLGRHVRFFVSVFACWCASAVDAAQGALRETLRIGLSSNARGKRSALLSAAVAAPEASAAAAPSGAAEAAVPPAPGPATEASAGELITPLPNDTISTEYWSKVDAAIYFAGRVTKPPSSFNDPVPTPTPEPWKKVFQASESVIVVDTPLSQANLNNWELATPMPPNAVKAPAEQTHRSMSVVPYDMQIGARIMYGLSEKNTETPPPSQAIVDETFVAQCPMLMFSNQLAVRAPRCGNPYGEWADPSTDRVVLRWKPTEQGGLYFGVDSSVSGQGSVTFADFTESFSINRYIFDLYNCLKVKRYIVEEAIVKVDQMAAKAYTTSLDHDLSGTKEAIFYEYTIKHPNGSAVAKTTLFRMDQDMVNFTWFSDSESPIGKLIAVATRTGHWKRDQWRQCTENPRGWDLTFTDAANFNTAASVQDLRVAAAAVLNMMAYRDEAVGKDGFQHVGEGALYWSFLSVIFTLLIISVCFILATVVCSKKGLDKKMKRFCFRLEQVLLPKRATKIRQPVLHPTY